jgi:hypothetical protein
MTEPRPPIFDFRRWPNAGAGIKRQKGTRDTSRYLQRHPEEAELLEGILGIIVFVRK